jgi:hypothetical protein
MLFFNYNFYEISGGHDVLIVYFQGEGRLLCRLPFLQSSIGMC